jgi:hypothetical protein
MKCETSSIYYGYVLDNFILLFSAYILLNDHHIAVIPEIMLNILTFDTNGPHSTWLYDKREECSFTITHFPQNSTILLRIEFYFHTSTATRKQLIF